MRKRPSDKPPNDRTEEQKPPSDPKPSHEKPVTYPLGLSAQQYDHVERKMLNVARLVCRHSGAPHEDAVQEAFLEAKNKSENERPSIQDFDEFVAWMCELAKWEALTIRNFYLRQSERTVDTDPDVAKMGDVPQSVSAVEARKMLEPVFVMLEPAQQELLHARYHDGKTIEEIANEQGLAWSTVDSRRQRLLKLLFAALKAMVATLVLLPKKARAFVTHVQQQAAHGLVQAAHVGGSLAITGVCGVLLPTGSSFMTGASASLGLTPTTTEQTNTTKMAQFPPSSAPGVAPEEPNGLDVGTNACSSGDMKCSKTASSVAENLMPMTFVLGVALSQVACVGSDQQTAPARQPEEERDDSRDPYDFICMVARARGEKCPTREEWLKEVYGSQ